uniref:Tyrosine-protein phosphatase domain-containing protein n=1 Tax=Panagrolaimus sp. ES5 TaxID=591445 RepID=A0AC34F826_9BILA
MDEEGGDRKQCIGVKDLEEEDFTGITTKFIIEERISYEGIGQIWKKNPQKNRYAIKCYDSNRVLLPSGVYINASHINALKAQDGSSTNFIATIGPKKNTARDFWEMVESLQVNSIIMLCRMVEEKKQKCYGYFPKVGTKVYGEYEVSVVDMNELIIKDGGDKETLKETHLTIKNL